MKPATVIAREKPLAERYWLAERNNVRAALNEFRASHPKGDTGKTYFIWFRGCSYPPKKIRAILDSRSPDTFSGGGKTNQMFRNLGFTIVKGTTLLAHYEHTGPNCSTSKCSIQGLQRHLDTLFQQKWVPLDEKSFKKAANPPLSQHPGVYLLAYTNSSLKGKKVGLEDVFYVGMSTTALRIRLKQFWAGIHDGGHHSGAMTFYRRWARNTNFANLNTDNSFYVVTLPIRCEPNKGLRTPADLEKMGAVAALEYFALARIKRALDLEPPLNKK